MPKKKAIKSKKSKVSKKVNTKSTKVKKTQGKLDLASNLSAQLKLKESYASLFLGIVVVVVAIVLGALLLRGKGYVNNPSLKDVKFSPSPSVVKETTRTYTVQEGEGLYGIAEKIYGNGEYWIKIVEANNLQNPDYVEPGTKLIIPDVK